jgi:hypothetical protein
MFWLLLVVVAVQPIEAVVAVLVVFLHLPVKY